MPRITKVYTRTGDDGTTALGVKTRVAKDDARVEAYGTVDELNSVLGTVLAGGVERRSRSRSSGCRTTLPLGSDLCIPEAEKETLPVPRIEARHVAMLEQWMDAWSEELEPLANFVLPGRRAAAAAPGRARGVPARGAPSHDACSARSRSAPSRCVTSTGCRTRCSSRRVTRTRRAESPSRSGTAGVSAVLRRPIGGAPQRRPRRQNDRLEGVFSSRSIL